MPLTKEEVKHIAQLARLGISEQETEKFSQELSSILDYVGELNAVDTKDVKPTSQVTGLYNIFRADEVREFGREKELIECAPEHQGGCIKTKPILE